MVQWITPSPHNTPPTSQGLFCVDFACTRTSLNVHVGMNCCLSRQLRSVTNSLELPPLARPMSPLAYVNLLQRINPDSDSERSPLHVFISTFIWIDMIMLQVLIRRRPSDLKVTQLMRHTELQPNILHVENIIDMQPPYSTPMCALTCPCSSHLCTCIFMLDATDSL